MAAWLAVLMGACLVALLVDMMAGWTVDTKDCCLVVS